MRKDVKRSSRLRVIGRISTLVAAFDAEEKKHHLYLGLQVVGYARY